MVLLYDWKRWRIVANADNSHHKQKKNDSVNIILLCAQHDRVNVLLSNDNKCTNKSI